MTKVAILDNFSIYYNEINKHPLLTEKEEKNLAEKWYYEKDLSAAQKLVLSNLRFVVKIAFQYKNYRLKMEDLVQEGNIGLMEAVKKFDPNQNVRLIHYASWWIKSKIQSYILKMWRLVKIGTTQAQRKLFFKMKQTQQKILNEHKNDPDIIKKVAKKLGVKRGEVEEMMIRLDNRERSIDKPISKDRSEATFEQIIPSKKDVEGEFIKKEEKNRDISILKKGLKILNDREQYILKERFFTDRSKTYAELGERFNISKQRIKQIETKAFQKLRTYFEKEK